MLDKLKARGCDEPVATATVAALAAEGLVSDERFIEALLHVRCTRGYGPLYIRRELEEKGIERGLIEQWLDPTAHDWLDDLRRVRNKKFGRGRPVNLAERARQTRFLATRGFTHEQIRTVLGSNDD